MLFLKHIDSISVSVMQENSNVPEQLFETKICNADETFAHERVRLLQSLIGTPAAPHDVDQFKAALTSLQQQGEEATAQLLQLCTQTTRCTDQEQQVVLLSEWWLSSCVAEKECIDYVMSLSQPYEERALPLAQVMPPILSGTIT